MTFFLYEIGEQWNNGILKWPLIYQD